MAAFSRAVPIPDPGRRLSSDRISHDQPSQQKVTTPSHSSPSSATKPSSSSVLKTLPCTTIKSAPQCSFQNCCRVGWSDSVRRAMLNIRLNLVFDRLFRLPDLGCQVGEQDAVQVVDLVLEDARSPVFEF